MTEPSTFTLAESFGVQLFGILIYDLTVTESLFVAPAGRMLRLSDTLPSDIDSLLPVSASTKPPSHLFSAMLYTLNTTTKVKVAPAEFVLIKLRPHIVGPGQTTLVIREHYRSPFADCNRPVVDL